MKNPIIFANWKMNPQTLREAKKIASFSDKKGVVIFPPFLFLIEIKKTLKKANIGAQNFYFEKEGAFTGEISSLMLKNIGCKYLLIGHSERRKYFAEKEDVLKKKIEIALSLGITPMLCIGEEKSRGKGGALKIKKQLIETLKGVELEKIIIAYEPVFAIGTGIPCEIKKAEERRVFIKNILIEIDKSGEKTPILYGGSVNDKNAKNYLYQAKFDGLLIGGASLKEKVFKNILKSIF